MTSKDPWAYADPWSRSLHADPWRRWRTTTRDVKPSLGTITSLHDATSDLNGSASRSFRSDELKRTRSSTDVHSDLYPREHCMKPRMCSLFASPAKIALTVGELVTDGRYNGLQAAEAAAGHLPPSQQRNAFTKQLRMLDHGWRLERHLTSKGTLS